MTLNPQEYYNYLKTHIEFLYFIGKKEGIIDSTIDLPSFRNSGKDIMFQCRQKLINNISLLDEYLTHKSSLLSDDEMDILTGFYGKITSTFIILKCLTHHAVFIDTKDNKFYAVKALGEGFDALLDYFPIMCEATILPFKNKIIYDGFMQPYKITIGPNIRRSMHEDYQQAKREGKIISTL